MPLFQRGDLIGYLADPFLQIRFGAILDLAVAETIARYMQLELGLQLRATGI
jgi:hypothetical protein